MGQGALRFFILILIASSTLWHSSFSVASELSCPRLVGSFVKLRPPKDLKTLYRKWVSADLDEVLAEMQAAGLSVALPPTQALEWPSLKTYSRYQKNWNEKWLESKESYGEFLRDRNLTLVNLKSKAFRLSVRDRERVFRWTLLHEFGHFWIQKKLYPERSRIDPVNHKAIFDQQVYVIPEESIENLTSKMASQPNRMARLESISLIFTAHRRSILEEILIEQSLNEVWLSEGQSPVGRFGYMASGARAFIYSTSNLLEVLVRLRDQNLISASDLSSWEKSFRSQTEVIIDRMLGILKQIEDVGPKVLGLGDKNFPIDPVKYALSEESFARASLEPGSEVQSEIARDYRLWSANQIFDRIHAD